METSWIHRYTGFDECLQDLFPEKFQFFPTNIKKSREYYETILVKTGSAIITHTPNAQNKQHIDFSKISIQRVWSYEDWGTDPWNEKRMNLPKNASIESHFNYFDYINA